MFKSCLVVLLSIVSSVPSARADETMTYPEVAKLFSRVTFPSTCYGVTTDAIQGWEFDVSTPGMFVIRAMISPTSWYGDGYMLNNVDLAA